MTKYILTSEHFTGALQFDYDNDSLLVFYSATDAVLSHQQLVGLLRKIPRVEGELPTLNETGYFKIRKLDEDISWENFWEQYAQKIHPHRCEPIWKKMSDIKKLAAIKTIGPYNTYVERKGIAKANPENYLKKEYWKTNWSKEI
jgi:hypothetical protein